MICACGTPSGLKQRCVPCRTVHDRERHRRNQVLARALKNQQRRERRARTLDITAEKIDLLFNAARARQRFKVAA